MDTSDDATEYGDEAIIDQAADYGNMALRDMHFTLSGVTPILMNNPAAMMNDGAEDTMVSRGKKKVYLKEEEAEKSAYYDPSGSRALVMPAVAVRRCIIDASTRYKPKGVTMGTMRMVVMGSLHMIEEWFPLTDQKGHPITHYAIDQRRVVVGSSGIIRTRASVLVPWQLRCHFWIDTNAANPTDIKNIIIPAGMMNGIGDYRPQKTGWFGRFTLADMHVS